MSDQSEAEYWARNAVRHSLYDKDGSLRNEKGSNKTRLQSFQEVGLKSEKEITAAAIDIFCAKDSVAFRASGKRERIANDRYNCFFAKNEKYIDKSSFYPNNNSDMSASDRLRRAAKFEKNAFGQKVIVRTGGSPALEPDRQAERRAEVERQQQERKEQAAEQKARHEERGEQLAEQKQQQQERKEQATEQKAQQEERKEQVAEQKARQEKRREQLAEQKQQRQERSAVDRSDAKADAAADRSPASSESALLQAHETEVDRESRYFAHAVDDTAKYPPKNDQMSDLIESRRAIERGEAALRKADGGNAELTDAQKQIQMQDRTNYYASHQQQKTM